MLEVPYSIALVAMVRDDYQIPRLQLVHPCLFLHLPDSCGPDALSFLLVSLRKIPQPVAFYEKVVSAPVSHQTSGRVDFLEFGAHAGICSIDVICRDVDSAKGGAGLEKTDESVDIYLIPDVEFDGVGIREHLFVIAAYRYTSLFEVNFAHIDARFLLYLYDDTKVTKTSKMEKTEKWLSEDLLKIKAVLLRPDNPFIWASGWHSPIYCDNRKILSYPHLRSKVALALADKVQEFFPGADVVAGVATGAIAHGILAADRLDKPFVYVRPKPKDHGTGSQIEGLLSPGQKVVVVEDLISTGMSSLAAVKALREAGAEVLGMAAIFTYGFDVSETAFKEAGVKLVTLTDYKSLISAAVSAGYVTEAQRSVLSLWRLSPSTWNNE